MSIDIEPNDWTCLDSWWSAYVQTQSIARHQATPNVFGMEQLAYCWDELDPWWQKYIESSPVTSSFVSARVFGLGRLSDCWDELAPWWNIYTETGYETAVTISDLLEQSNEEWTNSNAPFDTDPLSVDLTRKRFLRGPLQPTGEVDWSRWLAQLMRPSSALITELFDEAIDQAPSEVIREDQLSKQDGSFRRPDILLYFADRGISIEVKLGDENYKKTAETARLVERHNDNREWDHALLLPKRKKERLSSIVEPSLESRQDGRSQLEWTNPGPIDVIYWRDVTTAIRSLLHQGEVVDDHWAANAYVFCAVAEQQIMGFQPQPVVDRLADPVNVVDTIQPIGIADTLREQLTYLRERVDP